MNNPAKQAVIYCRVSSEKQVQEGHGIQGQQLRCEQYAQRQGYKILKVFTDEGVSGGLMNRPSMSAMIEFIKNQDAQTVVLFDDLSRLARGLQVHFTLKAEIEMAGGRIENVSMPLEETPEGKMIEGQMAVFNEYHRHKNRETVINRMKARAEKGCWCLRLPLGYQYTSHPMHGRLAIPEPSLGKSLKLAFEKFAGHELLSINEVTRFLKECHPVLLDNLHAQRVAKILSNPFYAGMVNVPKWGLANIKGNHTALISQDTFHKVQERLLKRTKTLPIKLLSNDFLLRGFIRCANCKNPLTASYSTGRGGQKHAYYHCHKKDCALRGKTFKRQDVEASFETALQSTVTAPQIVDLALAITKDVWGRKMAEINNVRTGLIKRQENLQAEIDQVIGSLTKLSNPTVIKHLEGRIAGLEESMDTLSTKLGLIDSEMPKVGTALDKVGDFIKSPYTAWKKGSAYQRRIVQTLVFAEAPCYAKETGVGTTELSGPFKLLRESNGSELNLVELITRNWNQYVQDIIRMAESLETLAA